MTLFSAKNIEVIFNNQKVLYDIDLTIHQDKILTIIGPNGSGKSTLLRLIIGAIKPNKGTIVKNSNLRIGYVPQYLNIDDSMPINVDRFLSIPHQASASQKKNVLERVDGEEFQFKQIRDLSGGQFQRILLARALLCRPNLLVLDEPTQGLDQRGTSMFYKLIEELRKQMGCGVVMVSHELNVVMRASDRVICLNGHICCDGTPDIVSNSPEYRALFDTKTEGALAIYRHKHSHDH